MARDQEVAGQLSGSLVWQVSAMPENPLSGNDCERLNWLRGVAAAGGIALVEPELALALNPPIPLPAKQITPHALRVWGSEAPTGGLIVGTDLEALGFASVGSSVVDASSKSTSAVDFRSPPSTRPSVLLSHLLLVGSPDVPLTDCWLRMDPGAAQWGEELLASTFGTDPSVRIVPYVAPSETTLTPLEQWLQFTRLQTWAFGGVVAGLLLSLAIWTRRSEFAIYRAFGTRASETVFLVAVENGLVLLSAGFFSMVVTLVAATLIGGGAPGSEIVEVVFLTILAAATTAYGLSLPLSAVALQGSVVGSLKDR